jgi:hypothetical protein
MVKFRVRIIKRRYKRKDFGYKKFLMEFPVRVYEKIEPHKNKNYDDIDITSKDTLRQEFLIITLVRNKTWEEINKQNRMDPKRS